MSPELSQILDGIAAAFLTLDEYGRIDLANASACTLLNRPANELRGTRIQDIWPDESRISLRSCIAAATDTQAPASFEWRTDGSGQCFATRVAPLQNGGAGVLILELPARDPETPRGSVNETDRRSHDSGHRTAELEQKVRDFETLYAALPVGVAISLDPDCKDIRCNDHMAAILGIEASQNASLHPLSGQSQPFRVIRNGVEIPPSQLPQDTAQREQRIVAAEYDVLRADGRLTSLYGHVVPLFDANGTLRGSVGAYVDITARKRDQEQLRESQRRLDLAVRSYGLGIYDWHIPSDTLQWSESEERLFGLEPNSFEGRIDAWASRVVPADAERVLRQVRECWAARGEALDFWFRAVLPDGSIRVLEGSAVLIYDADGSPLRMVGVNHDVTAREQTRAALEESHERLMMIQSGTGVGTWEWDLCSGRVTWSDEIYSILGMERTGAARTVDDWVNFIHPDDRDRATREADEAMVAASSLDSEFRIRRPDGEVRWILSKARIVRDDSGAAVRMVGLNLDITERKRVTEALREAEERQRLAAEAGQIGLWDWDIQTNRVVWSDRIYEFHGLTPESFGGTVEHFAALIHPEDRERVAGKLQSALSGSESYEIEFRTVRPDGRVRWLTTSARVVFDSGGNPLRMYGATIDTTERREAEDALRRTNTELEQFAFVASHDLQEPLRTVKLYSQLLVRRFDAARNPEVKRFEQFISSGVDQMERLIKDLLTYSRTVHEEADQPAEAVDARDALHIALAAIDGSIREADADISIGELPTVAADDQQLALVFQNLISNSLKYRRKGERPKISVTSRPDGSKWIIEVRDNGIGFEQEYAERIFGLFRRLHKYEYPGSGLGLAICRRIVERYGGRIWAESSPGVGSSFYISLRAAGTRFAQASD